MQAVIMAGGKGTRLRSITNDEIPKPMVKICGKPILQWQIENLHSNGINDFFLIIGHLGEKIKEYFHDGSKFGVKIKYYEEVVPLGTAGALPYIERLLEQNFLLVLGDLIFDVDISRIIDIHIKNQALATLMVHPNTHPKDSDIVLCNSENRITGFLGKNEQRNFWYKNRVNAGIYVINKNIIKNIPKGRSVDLEKDVLIPKTIRGECVYCYSTSEYLRDVGTPERIVAAEKDIFNGYIKSRNLKNKQKCIFLDRDGTINKYCGLLFKEEQFKLEKDVVEAIKMINESGYLAIVITNQPVVARGLCSVEDIENIHNKMETLLGEAGAYLDDVVFCPHHPDKGYEGENSTYKIKCHCRKPDIGMIEFCLKKFNIDLNTSWFVGDTTVDIKTGKNAELNTALVLTGEAGNDKKYDVQPDIVGSNLLEVIKKILGVKK